jgi:hypothetical protein
MLFNYDIEDRRKKKMHSEHRIIHIRPMNNGKSTLNSSGMVDNRLFTGENKLHATYIDHSGMWKLHYDIGAIPGGLQMQFTTLQELLTHVRSYFKKRNVEVVDVVDAS